MTLFPPSAAPEHRPVERLWTQDDHGRPAAAGCHLLHVAQRLLHHVRTRRLLQVFRFSRVSSFPRFPRLSRQKPSKLRVLCRLGFTVLLFLLRSLVSMNFNVVYIYTAEVRHPSAWLLTSWSRSQQTCLCSSGVPHRGPLPGDGLLHLLQPHRGDDRAVHRPGALSALDGAFRASPPHLPLRVLQVLMSRSVVQALSPFALASAVCALGTVLLPIETKGRALLVRNLRRLPEAVSTRLHPQLKMIFCFQQNS